MYPVTMMCRCLEGSRSGFYAWLQSSPCDRDVRDDVIEMCSTMCSSSAYVRSIVGAEVRTAVHEIITSCSFLARPLGTSVSSD